MFDKSKNITLIGMPGSGKSTLGVLLAKELGLGFVDTDILLQEHLGVRLQTYLDAHGYLALREKEQQVILEYDFVSSVISTGGSVVYSAPAMQKLGQSGPICYLQISQSELEKRVSNQDSRGLASPPGQTLADIYHERAELYARYATVVFDNNENDLIKAVCSLKQRLNRQTAH